MDDYYVNIYWMMKSSRRWRLWACDQIKEIDGKKAIQVGFEQDGSEENWSRDSQI